MNPEPWSTIPSSECWEFGKDDHSWLVQWWRMWRNQRFHGKDSVSRGSSPPNTQREVNLSDQLVQLIDWFADWTNWPLDWFQVHRALSRVVQPSIFDPCKVQTIQRSWFNHESTSPTITHFHVHGRNCGSVGSGISPSTPDLLVDSLFAEKTLGKGRVGIELAVKEQKLS